MYVHLAKTNNTRCEWGLHPSGTQPDPHADADADAVRGALDPGQEVLLSTGLWGWPNGSGNLCQAFWVLSKSRTAASSVARAD